MKGLESVKMISLNQALSLLLEGHSDSLDSMSLRCWDVPGS